MARAVVLLSGGLDSCVAAAMAKAGGDEILALSVDYGQRHARELEHARRIAAVLGAGHKVVTAPVGELGGSALTQPDIAVPDAPRDAATIGDQIPPTYVPARNTVFLALAIGYAEVVDADSVHIGANALDYSGYPDCRPEYFAAFQGVTDLATKRAVEGRPVRIVTPLLSMTKADIIRKGVEVGAPLELTWSCYRGGDVACGRCESCALRLKGFAEAGVEDPVAYEVLT